MTVNLMGLLRRALMIQVRAEALLLRAFLSIDSVRRGITVMGNGLLILGTTSLGSRFCDLSNLKELDYQFTLEKALSDDQKI